MNTYCQVSTQCYQSAKNIANGYFSSSKKTEKHIIETAIKLLCSVCYEQDCTKKCCLEKNRKFYRGLLEIIFSINQATHIYKTYIPSYHTRTFAEGLKSLKLAKTKIKEFNNMASDFNVKLDINGISDKLNIPFLLQNPYGMFFETGDTIHVSHIYFNQSSPSSIFILYRIPVLSSNESSYALPHFPKDIAEAEFDLWNTYRNGILSATSRSVYFKFDDYYGYKRHYFLTLTLFPLWYRRFLRNIDTHAQNSIREPKETVYFCNDFYEKNSTEKCTLQIIDNMFCFLENLMSYNNDRDLAGIINQVRQSPNYPEKISIEAVLSDKVDLIKFAFLAKLAGNRNLSLAFLRLYRNEACSDFSHLTAEAKYRKIQYQRRSLFVDTIEHKVFDSSTYAEHFPNGIEFTLEDKVDFAEKTPLSDNHHLMHKHYAFKKVTSIDNDYVQFDIEKKDTLYTIYCLHNDKKRLMYDGPYIFKNIDNTINYDDIMSDGLSLKKAPHDIGTNLIITEKRANTPKKYVFATERDFELTAGILKYSSDIKSCDTLDNEKYKAAYDKWYSRYTLDSSDKSDKYENSH